MWKIASGGESYYVDHVTCELPWSTKETPGNSHTKGSIKIKRCLLTIGDDNCAEITTLTEDDAERLSGKEKVIRIITAHGDQLRAACEHIAHQGIKAVGGGCSTTFYITEFNSDEDFVMFKLVFTPQDLRELKPNEEHYKRYEKFKGTRQEFIDEDDWEDDDQDEYVINDFIAS